MDWIQLASLTDLEEAISNSYSEQVAIFKHSSRCGISSFVLKRLERSLSGEKELSAKTYFLDLIAHRDVSNSIEQRLGVKHESPQLIIISNGKSVYNASHQSIDFNVLIA